MRQLPLRARPPTISASPIRSKRELPIRKFSGTVFATIGIIASAAAFIDEPELIAKHAIGFAALGLAWQMVVDAADSPVASLGLLLVAILTIYHGLPNILAELFPTPYRLFASVGNDRSADAFIIASCGMLAFALGYRAAGVHRGARRPIRSSACPKWLDRVSVPALWTYSIFARIYRGGAHNLVTSPTVLYWLDALLYYLEMPILTILILAVFRQSSRRILPRWTPWALLPYAVAIAFIANVRTEAIVVAASVVVVGRKWNLFRLSPVRIAWIAAGLLFFFASIAVIRGAAGREAIMEATPGDRANIMIDGLSRGLGMDSSTVGAFAFDLGYRVDGNAFLAAVQHEPFKLNLDPVATAMALSIPSSLYPAKSGLCKNGICNVEGAIIENEHMADLDYLPTVLAALIACFGYVGGSLLMAALGASLRLFEATAARPKTGMISGIATIALATTLAFGEGDISMLALAPRNVAMLTILFATVFWRRRLIASERFGGVRRAIGSAKI